MPFRFWGGEEAETEFRADVMTVHRNAGYKGCYPKAKTEEAWAELRSWSKRSSTARKLFAFIDESSAEINVVGMSGGFQCFSSTSGLSGKRGVIYVDLDAKLEILAKTSHNLHLPKFVLTALALKSRTRQQGAATRDLARIPSDGWVELDNRITLLHEIGHGKQWIEKPGWFDDDYRTATKKGVGDAAPTLKDISAREIRSKAAEMQQKRALAGKRPADLSFLPEDRREQGDTKSPLQVLDSPVVWGVPIEHDNMNRHEWPICREMGLPLRSNYGDIRDAGSVKNSQLTTLMHRWIDEENAENAKKNAARLGPTAKASCPVCQAEFPSNFKLGVHQRSTGHVI